MTSIGSYSMQTTIKTARLSVGENVKVIEDNAFTDNTSIKEVYWGKSAISTIGKDAFTRSSVSSFHYPHVAAAYYTIQDYGLNKSNSLQRVTFDRTYKQVAPSAFANC